MAKRPSITDIKGLGDFMVSNLWVIEIQAPQNLDEYGKGLGFDKLNFRAVSFEVPKRSGNSLEINIRGAKVKQPGDYDYSGQTTLTLAETEDADVHRLIRGWREAIIETNTNKQMRKEDIQTTVIVKRLNRQNEEITSGDTGWVLHGVFLEDYELGELTDTGDVIQPTLTLSYDFFIELDRTMKDSKEI